MGIVFSCTRQQLQPLKTSVDNYLAREGNDLHLVQSSLYAQTHTLQYALGELTAANGSIRTVIAVSKAEILYAM